MFFHIKTKIISSIPMFGFVSVFDTSLSAAQDMLSTRGNNPCYLQPTNSITNLRRLLVWPVKQKTAPFTKSHFFPLEMKVFKCLFVLGKKYQMVHHYVSMSTESWDFDAADRLDGCGYHGIHTRCQSQSEGPDLNHIHQTSLNHC